MLSTSKKSKKSKTKKRDFKISPLIPVIAVIEVIVLIVISSYAWFYISSSKVIGSGTISVDADSGLDIDFQYSNVDDYINIWNYVGTDFKFEPATSLDGRVIYFPTSGTFNNTDTEEIVFRDGTVNDINSKYLSIDFELTNTSGSDQYVYLNNNSYFKVKDESNRTQESRALRLAFYQNDGNSGNVGSSLLDSSNGSSDGGSGSSVSPDSYTVYFDNSSENWSNVFAYFWDSDNGTSPEYYAGWPGVQMTRVSGKIYSITIDNPSTGSNGVQFDKVIFNNNNGTQSSEFSLNSGTKGHKYNKTSDLGTYSEHTVYFLKPGTWNDNINPDTGVPRLYCHAFDNSNNTAYTSWPGDEMTYVGSGIYSYSYDSTNTGGLLFNNNGYDGKQTDNISIGSNSNGKLYYCPGNYTGSKLHAELYSSLYSNLSYNTIYFFNTYGWDKPYATVSMSSAYDAGIASTDIALTSLSGNVFYCTVPSVFDKVYFRQKNETAANRKTQVYTIENQRVYRPNENSNNNGYEVSTFLYSSYIKDSGYPVISPGVSAGFQRPYSPVITIDAFNGLATEIIPAYSNSIDNYILGSGTPLFVLKSGHMASLSMIMWLEGTDSSAVGDLYPGNDIDFKLEFSTLYYTENQQGDTEEHIVNPGDSASYTYNFYDKTREIWTSDRQSTESGVTVAPVMQLYDNTIKRGYLMSPSAYSSYGGKQKVSCWTVDAPQSIAKYGHDIIFRRVNPYDEDEVWNYWHAGPVAGERTKTNGVYNVYSSAQTIYDVAFSGGDTISFTAFADGSPIVENLKIGKKNENPSISDNDLNTYINNVAVPDDSCGGLWGNHNVRTLTLLDGTKNNFFQNDHGIMSIKFKYKYTGGSYSPETTIEYKASGPDYECLYNFVVPTDLYSTNRGVSDTNVAFKRYFNFNTGYAINSERNDRLLWDNTWDASAATGTYYEIGQEVTDSGNKTLRYKSYWGTDILYVQNNPTTYSYLYTDLDKYRMLQVKFYKDNTETKFYMTMFPNGEFKGTEANSMGYPVVVPNGEAYDRYQVQFCNTNGTKIYRSDIQTLYNYSGFNAVPRIISAYNSSSNKSENICVIDYFNKIRIYVESNIPAFKDSNDQKFIRKGKYNDEWPGNQMTWRGDNYYNQGYKRFYYEDIEPHNYSSFIVDWLYQGNRWQAPETSFTPEDDGTVFQVYYSGSNIVVNRAAVGDDPKNSDKKVLHISPAEAKDWPHYSSIVSS